VYLVKGSDIEEHSWQGEPFESLKFEDFGKILTPEQVEEKGQNWKLCVKKESARESWRVIRKNLNTLNSNLNTDIERVENLSRAFIPKPARNNGN
jgi:hypothetical protein